MNVSVGMMPPYQRDVRMVISLLSIQCRCICFECGTAWSVVQDEMLNNIEQKMQRILTTIGCQRVIVPVECSACELLIDELSTCCAERIGLHGCGALMGQPRGCV